MSDDTLTLAEDNARLRDINTDLLKVAEMAGPFDEEWWEDFDRSDLRDFCQEINEAARTLGVTGKYEETGRTETPRFRMHGRMKSGTPRPEVAWTYTGPGGSFPRAPKDTNHEDAANILRAAIAAATKEVA